MSANWLTVFSLGMVAVMSPGPDFALTLRNSLVYTRKTGIYTALGITVGNIVHVTYCLIGIGAIITRSIVIFNIIKMGRRRLPNLYRYKIIKSEKTSRRVYN